MSEHKDNGDIFFYDTQTNQLLVGDSAYEEAIESGAHPADIVDLKDVINDQDIDSNEACEKLYVDDWSVSDYSTYGKWLYSIVDSPLKKIHLDNAYRLGLGPEPQRIYRPEPGSDEPRFNGFGDFFKSIGSNDSYIRYEYDHLDYPELLSYVRKTANRIAGRGVRPTVEKFEERARNGKGPYNKTVKRITGEGFSALLDNVGYPNTSSWSEEEYVDWGVKFAITNSRLPYRKGLDELSQRFRGPSYSSIERRFGGMLAYKAHVEDALEKMYSRQNHSEQLKIDAIKIDHEKNLFPPGIVETDDNTELIRNVAQFRVAKIHVNGISPIKMAKISTSRRPELFIRRIIAENPHTSEAEIEITAEELGVFDDIWRDEEYLEWLKVES